MKKTEIHIPGGDDIFKHLAHALLPYHAKTVGSHLFIVEGTLAQPRILKKQNKNSILWTNLFDFEVVPFEKGSEGSSVHFTYANLLKDFETHKKDSIPFWEMVVRVHDHNVIDKEPPKLGGIESRQFISLL